MLNAEHVRWQDDYHIIFFEFVLGIAYAHGALAASAKAYYSTANKVCFALVALQKLLQIRDVQLPPVQLLIFCLLFFRFHIRLKLTQIAAECDYLCLSE
jgi:hypothetical protein